MNRHAGFLILLSGAFACAGAAPAWAQEEMYPGQSVQVNQGATQGGVQVLLYPDNQHTRVVPILRQPGDTGDVVHLHMPVKHRVVHRVKKPETEVAAAEPAADATPAYTSDLGMTPPPAPAPAPKKQVVAVTKPQPQKPAAQSKPAPQQKPAAKPQAPVKTASNGGNMGFSFGGSDLSEYGGSVGPAAPQKPTPAKATPADNLPTAGLTRRSQILFAANAADPAPSAHDAIKMLGGDLNMALAAGAERIQLQAYGGARNDKSSDARRLSLKRAIAIRAILIEGGVPANKIDVRAMGGAPDGAADRVDVLIRG